MEINLLSDLNFGDVMYVRMKHKTLSFLYCGKQDDKILALLLRQGYNPIGSLVEIIALDKVYHLKARNIRDYETRLVSDETKDLILRSLFNENPEQIPPIEIQINIIPKKNDFICYEGKAYYLANVYQENAYLYSLTSQKNNDAFEYIGEDGMPFYICLTKAIKVSLSEIGFLMENPESLNVMLQAFTQRKHVEQDQSISKTSYSDLILKAKRYRKEILGFSLRHNYLTVRSDKEKNLIQNVLFSLRAGLETGLIYSGESSSLPKP